MATNAARYRMVAGKAVKLLEFGLRRAQGPVRFYAMKLFLKVSAVTKQMSCCLFHDTGRRAVSFKICISR